VKPWQWDPTKWTIWTLSKLGLVEGLRRVPDSKILLAEMREARIRAEKHLAELREHGPGPPNAPAMRCMKWSPNASRSANYHELEKAVADRVQLAALLSATRARSSSALAGHLKPGRAGGNDALAYDWRAEHIPTFDAEVEAMKAHGIEISSTSTA
jgi:stearoyl-CoA desaturase (Delta-9 desaturase)